MTATLRRLCGIIFVAAVAALPSACVAAQQLPGTSFRSDDALSKVGVYRPNQVLALLETVSWMTVGDFKVHPISPGTVSTTPVVTVGGMPMMNGAVFGMVNLNAIAFDPALWDSVTVSHNPSVQSGSFRTEPVIEIVPREPGRSLHATGGGWVANGSGDPGPHQYLDSTLFNVERIGPGGHATVSYGTDAWFVETYLRGRRHGLLSPYVSPRLARAYDGPRKIPRMRSASIALRSKVAVGRSRFDVRAHRTELDDFLLLEAVGHEFPAAINTTSLQLRGTTALTSYSKLRFGAANSTTQTAPRPGSLLAWTFDWSESRSHAFAEIEAGPGTVGAAVIRHSGASPSMDFGASYYLATAYASGGLSLSDAVSQSAGLHVTIGKETAPAFWALTTIRPSSDVQFDVSGSAGYRLVEDRPTLWYWHERGYDVLEQAGVRVERFDPSRRTRFATLRVTAEGSLSPTMRVSAGTFGSISSDLNLVTSRFRVYPLTNILSGDVSVDGDGSGTIWGAMASVESQPHDHLSQRAGYAYSHPLGSPSYRRALARQPRHKVTAAALFEPNDRFSLGALVRIESATRWHAFTDAAPSSELYADRLPARVGVDLTAFKRLWGPRMDVGLTVRNVLGRPLRFHPLGVEFPTTLAVRLVLRSGDF